MSVPAVAQYWSSRTVRHHFNSLIKHRPAEFDGCGSTILPAINLLQNDAASSSIHACMVICRCFHIKLKTQLLYATFTFFLSRRWWSVCGRNCQWVFSHAHQSVDLFWNCRLLADWNYRIRTPLTMSWQQMPSRDVTMMSRPHYNPVT